MIPDYSSYLPVRQVETFETQPIKMNFLPRDKYL